MSDVIDGAQEQLVQALTVLVEQLGIAALRAVMAAVLARIESEITHETPPRRTLTIEKHDSGMLSHWVIREGDRSCDKLGWDEMVAQLVTLTHPDIPAGKALYHGMMTAAEVLARDIASKRRRDRNQQERT